MVTLELLSTFRWIHMPVLGVTGGLVPLPCSVGLDGAWRRAFGGPGIYGFEAVGTVELDGARLTFTERVKNYGYPDDQLGPDQFRWSMRVESVEDGALRGVTDKGEAVVLSTAAALQSAE